MFMEANFFIKPIIYNFYNILFIIFNDFYLKPNRYSCGIFTLFSIIPFQNTSINNCYSFEKVPVVSH